MVENDIYEFTWVSKKPRISVKTVSVKQNRNMDLQLALLETIMSKQNLPRDRNILQI